MSERPMSERLGALDSLYTAALFLARYSDKYEPTLSSSECRAFVYPIFRPDISLRTFSWTVDILDQWPPIWAGLAVWELMYVFRERETHCSLLLDGRQVSIESEEARVWPRPPTGTIVSPAGLK